MPAVVGFTPSCLNEAVLTCALTHEKIKESYSVNHYGKSEN
jgi:hypothetical protein